LYIFLTNYQATKTYP